MANNIDRVSVIEASKELQMDQESVRCLMQQGRLPIGYAFRKPNGKQWTYYIYRGLLDQELKRIATNGRKW